MDDNKNMTRESNRKIIIKTQQGEVEVNGIRHDQPGVCPNCHKAIPLSAVVFKKMDENKNMATYTGGELARKFGIEIWQQDEVTVSDAQNGQVGECPYCHEPIPLREVIFKEKK
jgi:RNA polymerase-binding transcription factor DksA